MVKCKSLRINMLRITHTGKSMNFPVTGLNFKVSYFPDNFVIFKLVMKRLPYTLRDSWHKDVINCSFLRNLCCMLHKLNFDFMHHHPRSVLRVHFLVV